MSKAIVSISAQKEKIRQRIAEDKEKLKKLEAKHVEELGALAHKSGLGEFDFATLEKKFLTLANELSASVGV